MTYRSKQGFVFAASWLPYKTIALFLRDLRASVVILELLWFVK